MANQVNEENPNTELQENSAEENGQPRSKDFREMSYVILFIAAVFVINAMETGSYRTPWPVAIITSLVGLGLLGYSMYLKSRQQ